MVASIRSSSFCAAAMTGASVGAMFWLICALAGELLIFLECVGPVEGPGWSILCIF